MSVFYMSTLTHPIDVDVDVARLDSLLFFFIQYISVIYATIALFIYTSLADRVKVVTIGTCWLSFEASADIRE